MAYNHYMPKQKTPEVTSHTGRRVLFLVFFLLLLYAVVPRLGNFSASFDTLRGANFWYVALAVILVAATYCLAAGTYWLVALKPLKYGRTLGIQSASAFANRLLPAGLGGLTLNVQYLRKSGHTTAQAAVVAGVNNLLGGAGHLLLLGLVLLFSQDAPALAFNLPDIPHGWLILGTVLGLVTVLLLAFKTLRAMIYKTAGQIAGYLASYRKRPGQLGLGLLSSSLLTGCYALILYLSALSLGAELSVLHVFVVFTVGVAAATATPTPGGLVGAEAGLTAGLVGYGVDSSMAFAIALLYRFLTYWLPLVPGFVIFIKLRRLYS